VDRDFLQGNEKVNELIWEAVASGKELQVETIFRELSAIHFSLDFPVELIVETLLQTMVHRRAILTASSVIFGSSTNEERRGVALDSIPLCEIETVVDSKISDPLSECSVANCEFVRLELHTKSAGCKQGRVYKFTVAELWHVALKMAIEGEAKANSSHKVVPAFEAWQCVLKTARNLLKRWLWANFNLFCRTCSHVAKVATRLFIASALVAPTLGIFAAVAQQLFSQRSNEHFQSVSSSFFTLLVACFGFHNGAYAEADDWITDKDMTALVMLATVSAWFLCLSSLLTLEPPAHICGGRLLDSSGPIQMAASTSFDVLLERMVDVSSSRHLSQRHLTLFHVLDEEDLGALTVSMLMQGLNKLLPLPSERKMTIEDLQPLFGHHTDSEGYLSAIEFDRVMRELLHDYAQRSSSSAASINHLRLMLIAAQDSHINVVTKERENSSAMLCTPNVQSKEHMFRENQEAVMQHHHTNQTGNSYLPNLHGSLVEVCVYIFLSRQKAVRIQIHEHNIIKPMTIR